MAQRKAPRRLLTRVQVGAALGVSRVTVERFVSEGRLVAVRRPGRAHSYDAADVDRLRGELEKGRTEPGAAFDLDAERMKFMRARRIRCERENLVREGELLEREAVVREGQAVLFAIRARLLSLPRQAVMRGVIQRETEPALKALIVEVLRELAQWKTVEDLEQAGARAELT